MITTSFKGVTTKTAMVTWPIPTAIEYILPHRQRQNGGDGLRIPAKSLLKIAEVVFLFVLACWLKLYRPQAAIAKGSCLKKLWADSPNLITWSRYLVSLISKASWRKNSTRSDYHSLSWSCRKKVRTLMLKDLLLSHSSLAGTLSSLPIL